MKPEVSSMVLRNGLISRHKQFDSATSDLIKFDVVSNTYFMEKIYIDCGGYDGDTVELFIKNYPEANQFKIFCFEPNPELFEKIKKNTSNHENIVIYNKAVWIEDGEKNFFLAKNPQGSSLLSNKIGRCKLNLAQPIKVNTVDLSKWIKINFNKYNYIVLKLDVEGAEYPIIEKMINEDTISYINDLYVEWHTKKLANFDFQIHQEIIEKLNAKKIECREMIADKSFNHIKNHYQYYKTLNNLI